MTGPKKFLKLQRQPPKFACVSVAPLAAPVEPHNMSLLGEGHHTVTRGPSKAEQELAVGLIATYTPLKIRCYPPDLLFMHTKYYVLHHFQDQVLPRLKKKPKQQMHHVMIANTVIFI